MAFTSQWFLVADGFVCNIGVSRRMLLERHFMALFNDGLSAKKALMRVMLLVLTLLIFVSHTSATDAIKVIDSNKVIEIATTEWPPYFSDHFKDQGYLSDMTKQAFANVGLTAKVHFVPWMRAMKLAKLGQFDAVLGAYWNEERAKDYLYSDILVHADVGFIILKENQQKLIYTGQIESIEPYVIGVMKGHIYSDAFDQAVRLKKRGANDKVNLISWLFTKDVDMIAGGQQVLMQVAKENFPARVSELVPIKPSLNRHAIYVIFAKQQPQSPLLLEQFNKGLKQLKTSGHWNSLAKKHGFEPEAPSM
jgi:polar amino acid transport system substrate-binding protein